MKNTIQVVYSGSCTVCFDAFSPFHPEVLHPDAEPYPIIEGFCCYDYERLPENVWRIYIDFSMKIIPFGDLLTRSTFEIEYDNLTWDRVFVDDIITIIVKMAISETSKIYKKECEERKISLPEDISIAEEDQVGISNNIIEQYYSTRKKWGLENELLLNSPGLISHKGHRAIAAFQYTFLVLDEILFFNTDFDRKHNRKMFEELIPMSTYFTLRSHCREIQDHDVVLTIYHTIVFYHCIECALDILLGNKADLLIPILDKKGFLEEDRNYFFQCATKLIALLYQMFGNSNECISNMDKKLCWDQLLR